MMGRKRIVSDRIIIVLGESKFPLSPKEIKLALESKGFNHAYEPISRNLQYLLEKGIVELMPFTNRFNLVNRNKNKRNKNKWVHWDKETECLVHECPKCGFKEKVYV